MSLSSAPVHLCPHDLIAGGEDSRNGSSRWWGPSYLLHMDDSWRHHLTVRKPPMKRSSSEKQNINQPAWSYFISAWLYMTWNTNERIILVHLLLELPQQLLWLLSYGQKHKHERKAINCGENAPWSWDLIWQKSVFYNHGAFMILMSSSPMF